MAKKTEAIVLSHRGTFVYYKFQQTRALTECLDAKDESRGITLDFYCELNISPFQYNFDVIFTIGRSLNVSIQNRLEREAELYGDILQSNALDDYKLLPVKVGSI